MSDKQLVVFRNSVNSFDYRDVALADGSVVRFWGACGWKFSDVPAVAPPFIKRPNYKPPPVVPSFIITAGGQNGASGRICVWRVEFHSSADSADVHKVIGLYNDEEKSYNGISSREQYHWITALSDVVCDGESRLDIKMTYIYNGLIVRVFGTTAVTESRCVPQSFYQLHDVMCGRGQHPSFLI